ncbi:histone-like nucleoid-structuring protein, MvaT/MvaU family [Pseudomonas huaxiensis]|uniref:histone-like nucleoid-structuring protein, MvaT/MvaU family n=1 Tax=Pseudomonas huaxiensis TaxID=2213017 RepID=UPI000DA68422|nr:histone-like nucleoid-structuring protein, MvaT/MvaU family [Pseudomonas huaxiensis]
MSRLAEFRKLEQQLAAQLAELETLKNDVGLKKEFEFETKLRALLAEYGFNLGHVIALLDPQASARRPAVQPEAAKTRKPRTLKVYKNPHNGEVVETKGGNHKTLKDWKSQYGQDVVESWLSQ